MDSKKEKKQITRAKKKLGQNFLKDNNILEKISLIKNTFGKNVVEIGLGQGDLTKVLSSKAKQVICYEIDKDLIENFGETFSSSNVKIEHQDFLKATFN